MKISAKCRYAIRALIDLNIHYKGTPVSVKEIVKRQNISERYLENIFNALKKAQDLAEKNLQTDKKKRSESMVKPISTIKDADTKIRIRKSFDFSTDKGLHLLSNIIMPPRGIKDKYRFPEEYQNKEP